MPYWFGVLRNEDSSFALPHLQLGKSDALYSQGLAQPSFVGLMFIGGAYLPSKAALSQLGLAANARRSFNMTVDSGVMLSGGIDWLDLSSTAMNDN